MLRARLAAIAGSAPTVEKFSVPRDSAKAILNNPQNIEASEQLDPLILAQLQDTKPLNLTRAERPMAFNVALLTRNVVEERGNISELQYGFGKGAQDDEGEDSFEQGEGEDEY